jgi:hypothetical protein
VSFVVTDGESRRFQLELASVLWIRRVRIDLDVNAGAQTGISESVTDNQVAGKSRATLMINLCEDQSLIPSSITPYITEVRKEWKN